MINPDEKLFVMKKLRFLESDIFDFIKKDHLCVCNDKKVIQKFMDDKLDKNGKMKSGYYKGYFIEIIPTNRPKVKYLFRFIKYDRTNTRAICVPLILNKNKMYILSVYDYDNELGFKYTDVYTVKKVNPSLESITTSSEKEKLPEEVLADTIRDNAKISDGSVADSDIPDLVKEEKRKKELEQELIIHSRYNPFLVSKIDEKSENLKKVFALVQRVTDKRLVQFFPKHNTNLTMNDYSAANSMILKVVYAKADLIEVVSTVDGTDLVVVIIDDMTYLVLSYGDSLIQIPIYDLKNERPFQQLGMLIGAIKHKGNKLRFKRISLKPRENDKKFSIDDLSSQLNLPIN